jgi:riboflavin kinase/FMN adenylyltransferase
MTRAEGQRIKAAISDGTNPTFDGVERRVEAYGIDVGHDLDLYDEHVTVEFASRLRGMERFDSVDDLVVQMHRDVDESRDRLR